MNLTNPKREKTQAPRCPNCNTDLTGKTRNWGSPDEGDYIVYQCPTCAEYFGSDLDGMVYQPEWETRPAGAILSKAKRSLSDGPTERPRRRDPGRA